MMAVINPFDSLQRLFRKEKQTQQSFIGFKHNDLIGIRSNYYVLPLSQGATYLARLVALESNLQLLENCADSADINTINHLAQDFLPKLARHPHTAGIFLLAVGDESTNAKDIAAMVRDLGTPCEYLNINECSDIEVASTVAVGTATELKTMALSGLDRIEQCELTITYHSVPDNFDALLELLEKNNFSVRLHQIQESRAKDLAMLALSGVHAIFSYVSSDDYPSGTLTTPVINIASTSKFHQAISSEFDLAATASHAEILQKIQEVFGMVKTFSETTKTSEKLFPTNQPLLDYSDNPKEICVLPDNPILIHFLIDLLSHQPGIFLGNWENLDPGKLEASKILFVGTGALSDNKSSINFTDSRIESLTIQDFGSLHGLAKAIISEATKPN
jgi:hypothetical protein